MFSLLCNCFVQETQDWETRAQSSGGFYELALTTGDMAPSAFIATSRSLPLSYNLCFSALPPSVNLGMGRLGELEIDSVDVNCIFEGNQLMTCDNLQVFLFR